MAASFSVLDSPSFLDSSSTVSCDPGLFGENFNKLPFEIEHSLASDPRFELSRLVKLARDVAGRNDPHRPTGDAACLLGKQDPGRPMLEGAKITLDVAEAIHQIETANAWIVLKHVERDPDYREILESCICDLLRLTGKEMRRQIKWFEAILFVSSPGRATPYHIDRECSWLLQIAGDKEIHLFNRQDREVTPNEELERFWTLDNGAGTYKPQFESRAMVYKLRPGTGVHIPVNTPHWLRNGKKISISLNVNFVFHDSMLGNIYRANYYMRKRGLHPAQPGTNPVSDRIKSAVFSSAQQLNCKLKRKPYVPQTSIEQNERIFGLLDQRA
jgi:hypothetical protein